MARVRRTLPPRVVQVTITEEALAALRAAASSPDEVPTPLRDEAGMPVVLLTPRALASIEARAFPGESIGDAIVRQSSRFH